MAKTIEEMTVLELLGEALKLAYLASGGAEHPDLMKEDILHVTDYLEGAFTKLGAKLPKPLRDK